MDLLTYSLRTFIIFIKAILKLLYCASSLLHSLESSVVGCWALWRHSGMAVIVFLHWCLGLWVWDGYNSRCRCFVMCLLDG